METQRTNKNTDIRQRKTIQVGCKRQKEKKNVDEKFRTYYSKFVLRFLYSTHAFLTIDKILEHLKIKKTNLCVNGVALLQFKCKTSINV